MKRKLLATILYLAISVSMIACGNVNTSEQQEVMATEQTTETEIIETSTEQVEENTSEQVEQANISEEADTSIDTSDTSSSDATSEYLSESDEISHSKWADINGAWDAVHQFTLYAREQGADDTDGWCWGYYNGKGAGDQPSYAVYMKEGDPLYGTVYHVGDYLPDGTQFSGTNDEWEAFIKQDFEKLLTEDGSVSFKDPETGRTIIGTQEEIDAYKASKGYN